MTCLEIIYPWQTPDRSADVGLQVLF